MKTQIFKTRNEAVEGAKNEAISEMELATQITLSKEELDVNKLASSLWLIKNSSCQCDCGESQAIRVVLFWDEKQYYGLCGICESCGE